MPKIYLGSIITVVLCVRTASCSNFKVHLCIKDAARKWSPVLGPLQPRRVTAVMEQVWGHLYTSVWSNVASRSQKQTIGFGILQIWWCFHASNEQDLGNMEFKIRLSVPV